MLLRTLFEPTLSLCHRKAALCSVNGAICIYKSRRASDHRRYDKAVGEMIQAPVIVPHMHGCVAGHCVCMPVASAEVRTRLAKRGRQLEVITVLWAALEAGVALAGAHREHSVSLAGFGWDSCIEMLSGAALYWRMTHEMDHDEKHRAEALSLKVAGFCLYALAAYVLVESVLELRMGGGDHSPGWTGIAITTAALVTMPILTRAKRNVARGLNSRAMMTDAAQTNFCAIQAGIVLSGLVVRSLLHVDWADAVAGMVLVPFLVRAAQGAFRGEACCSH